MIARALWRLAALGDLVASRGRAALLRVRGARVGAKSNVGRRCRMLRPFGIAIGTRCVLEDDVYLKLVADDARVTLGDFTFLGRGCEIDASLRVTIGAHSLLAPGVFVTDHAHAARAGEYIDRQGITSRAVAIGDDVWIGTGSVILPGVTIGDGAIVGARSVVTKDIAPDAIVAGAPARVLRSRGAR